MSGLISYSELQQSAPLPVAIDYPAALALRQMGVDSEFGKNRTFTKNKWKHYRLFLNSRAAHYGFEKAEHITVC
ncbi:MAG: hypothetical protein PHI97_33930, partial [Desulfobulbus sp.]|nr:hypothetical protein [Desulfobulbus sp.]